MMYGAGILVWSVHFLLQQRAKPQLHIWAAAWMHNAFTSLNPEPESTITGNL